MFSTRYLSQLKTQLPCEVVFYSKFPAMATTVSQAQAEPETIEQASITLNTRELRIADAPTRRQTAAPLQQSHLRFAAC